ncbi:MAG: DMT family transporter [Candidatus Bipolaricaulota bacterium]|nr:DMT family transporter [Candidatus Bipolaricaulota bacterium]MDW8030216.1 DMT family transporter [Candidatus Bipolaricaulota bacterium]
MRINPERLAELLLGFVIFIWGANFIVMKAVFREFPPLAFNAVRMTLAALVLGAIWLARERSKKMPMRDWLQFGGVGLLGNTLYQILFAIGLDLTTSAISSLLIGTIPIWAALLAMVLGWEKISQKAWLGIFIAFTGVILVTLGSPSVQGNPLAKDPLMGNLLTLGAAICWAGYTVLSKRLLERYSALRVSAVGLLVGVPGLWPFAMPYLISLDWRALPLSVFVSLLYTSCLSIAVAYLIWSYSVQQLGAARTAVFNNIVPVITFILAFLVLGEPITGLQLLGGAVVLAGVWQTIREKGANAR